MSRSVLSPVYTLPSLITTTPQSSPRIRGCYLLRFTDDKTEV